ncbi:DUF6270 domain-containing protein [Cytobacillus sp. FSL K6-0129]|uniref:DUF6270 domain-containing protein n=1 Tax=Cytobacillus sp. FSL K6-0129 TaxID=2921421 RepID=UPI0030FC1EA2
MKEKVTVGVLGCCVSRDNFNSMFNKSYSDISKCVIHQNQSSLLSVMSEAVSFDAAKINNLDKDFDRLHLISELDKSFLGRIAKEKPDYLIIDFFGDVLFGVFEYLGSYITNNTWKFPRTTFYKELESKKVLSPA